MDYKTYSPEDNIALIKENKEVDYKKALITLNGKEITADEIDKISPTSIESILTFGKTNNSNLIAKYGEKAKNGVIIIEKYGYKEPISEEQTNELAKNFKLDSENGSFTIHKRSKKSDFEFYEKYLDQIGVDMKISAVERDKKGYITAIKIKLVDKVNKSKSSASYDTSRNLQGIPEITVGRINGILFAASK